MMYGKHFLKTLYLFLFLCWFQNGFHHREGLIFLDLLIE